VRILPLVAMLMIGLFLGCAQEQTEKTSAEDEELQILLEKQAQEILEIRNSQKGEEFRNLSMAIPIGEDGRLRIVIPKDDEGNDLYSPSEFIGAYLNEADKIRSVAAVKVPKEKKKEDPPSLPAVEGLLTREDLKNLLEAFKATDQKVDKVILAQQIECSRHLGGQVLSCTRCHSTDNTK